LIDRDKNLHQHVGCFGLWLMMLSKTTKVGRRKTFIFILSVDSKIMLSYFQWFGHVNF
jgi:hypothetical protein